MSIFVIDNNIFSRTLRNMAMDSGVFDNIYKPLEAGLKNGTMISVDEVYLELHTLWGAENAKDKRVKEGEWLKKYKSAFKSLTDAEGKILADIFKNKKFREGIKEKSLRAGSYEADAILVAKAKCVNGIVVTAESTAKPNSEKIPNICVAQGVPFIGIQDFYKVLNNISQGKSELEGVILRRSLDAK